MALLEKMFTGVWSSVKKVIILNIWATTTDSHTNASSATIWVVECKEYEKVESAYDYMQLQQRWFGQDGKLLKFERRIKYMQDHLEEIANDLGLAHQDPLQLRPYLVSNKIFTNLIGDSNFQVITLSELNELLSRRTC